MIDADDRLRAEVDRLIPTTTAFAANWHDVMARAAVARPAQWRRKGVLLLAAALAAAIFAGIAFGATEWFNRGSDRILTIASGEDWSLVAHRKHGHLCVSYGAPGVEADSCQLKLPQTLDLFTLAPTANGHARLIGLVAPGVSKVEATSPSYKVHASIYPLPAFFRSPLRLFVAELPDRSILRIALAPSRQYKRVRLTVTAYGRNGRSLRTITF
jgi:hypothetical protein